MVVERLVVRRSQVQPRRLLFDDQRSRPEQVDEPLPVVRQVADSRFIGRDLCALDAKTLEEVVVKALRVAALAGCRGLFF
jgi:hypothetical protein